MQSYVNEIIKELLNLDQVTYIDPVDDGEMYFIGIKDLRPLEVLFDTSEKNTWYIVVDTASWKLAKPRINRKEMLAYIATNTANETLIYTNNFSPYGTWELSLQESDGNAICKFRFVARFSVDMQTKDFTALINLIEASLHSVAATYPNLQKVAISDDVSVDDIFPESDGSLENNSFMFQS